MGKRMRIGVATALAAVVVPAAVVAVPRAGAQDDLTRAQAIAIVRDFVGAGLECAYPGSGLRPVGFEARSRADGFTVTVTVRGTDRSGAVVSFGIAFDVLGPTEVKAPSLATQKILDCVGPIGAAGKCASRKKGLVAQPPTSKPIARYGPIAVYRAVPGLKIVKMGGAWVISGLKVARLSDPWAMDDCTGVGRITSASLVVSRGKPVARVGDRVVGDEVTECPTSPLHVGGVILTGDPRIAIDGRPVAVSGSRIRFQPSCASGKGHVS